MTISLKPFLLLIFLSLHLTFYAQITETDQQMFWSSFSIQKKINKHLKLNYFQLNSFNMDNGQMNFIQSDFGITYKLSKHWSTGINYTPTFSLDDIAGNQLVYHRVSAKIKVSNKITRHIYVKNFLVAEYHFTQRSKWQERLYYRLDIEYKNKRKMPWKMRPYISQKLYWYQNGRLLQYYDSDGNTTILASTDGLHAYRIKTGVKIYPAKNWSFNIYYLRQTEFNTQLFGGNELNSLNPNTNNIRRSFYDFNVWGLTIGYKL